jgi:hypothetical protein
VPLQAREQFVSYADLLLGIFPPSLSVSWSGTQLGGYVYTSGFDFQAGTVVNVVYMGVPAPYGTSPCKTSIGRTEVVDTNGRFSHTDSVRITSHDSNCVSHFPYVTVAVQDQQGNVLAIGSVSSGPWCP